MYFCDGFIGSFEIFIIFLRTHTGGEKGKKIHKWLYLDLRISSLWLYDSMTNILACAK